MMPSMKYIDKYPGCAGCPHHKYCGTMVSSIRLCNSYERDNELSEEELLPSVMGQLIYRARINYDLWKCILDFATKEANDGYPGLVEYLEEPVNCHCECIEGTPWCEIELGADSFREEEWVALHRIVSCIQWHYRCVANVDVQWQSCEGLQLNDDYMVYKPFTPTKEMEAALDESREYLTPEQGTREAQRIYPLKAYDPEEEEEISDQD